MANTCKVILYLQIPWLASQPAFRLIQIIQISGSKLGWSMKYPSVELVFIGLENDLSQLIIELNYYYYHKQLFRLFF